MRTLRFVAILLVIGVQDQEVVQGQTTTYKPFGTLVDPDVESLTRWNQRSQSLSERLRPVRPESRPQLAGLRPKNVEILEYALLKKHPKLLGNNPTKARDLLLRRYQHNLAQLRGYMAEAVLVDRNLEWRYVAKPNASQHDVYRWLPGQNTPRNGQVKYHDSGRPADYARDMIRDHRALSSLFRTTMSKPRRRTFDPKRSVSRQPAIWSEPKGNGVITDAYGPSASSAEIRSATNEVARHIARERYATYTSLGASLVLSLPTLYAWANGDLSANVVAYRTARSLSQMGMAYGTDLLLQRIGQGALRGTIWGNVFMGAAITITEVAWLLHEHGWQRAFYQPVFYEQAVGGISGLALGLAGGTFATGLAVETGPWAPLIGTVVGIGTGTIGYLGGRAATQLIIEILAPEMLRTRERQRFQVVKSSLDRSIARLQSIEVD